MKSLMPKVSAVAVLVALTSTFPAAQGDKTIPMNLSGGKPGSPIDLAMNAGKLGSVIVDSKGSATIALAMNGGKISVVPSGSHVTSANPLDVANQGKVQAQIAVETCKGGKTTIILITKGEQVPKDENCDRKIASSLFWVDKVNSISVNVAALTAAVTTSGGLSAMQYGLIAAGGGVGGAVAALGGGGSSSSSSTSSSQTPPSTSTPTPAPAPTPTPTPTPTPGLTPGAIGGMYTASGTVNGPSCGLVSSISGGSIEVKGDALDKIAMNVVTAFSTLIGSLSRTQNMMVNPDGTFQGFAAGQRLDSSGMTILSFTATVTGRFTVGSSGSMTVTFSETIRFTEVAAPNCALTTGPVTTSVTATKAG